MSIEKVIDIGKEYSSCLTDRNKYQTQNPFNAEDFRNKYLLKLDNEESWNNSQCKVILDFSNVKKISPGFANEAFAYFTKYAKNIEDFFAHIIIQNASEVKYHIILTEIKSRFTF